MIRPVFGLPYVYSASDDTLTYGGILTLYLSGAPPQNAPNVLDCAAVVFPPGTPIPPGYGEPIANLPARALASPGGVDPCGGDVCPTRPPPPAGAVVEANVMKLQINTPLAIVTPSEVRIDGSSLGPAFALAGSDVTSALAALQQEIGSQNPAVIFHLYFVTDSRVPAEHVLHAKFLAIPVDDAPIGIMAPS